MCIIADEMFPTGDPETKWKYTQGSRGSADSRVGLRTRPGGAHLGSSDGEPSGPSRRRVRTVMTSDFTSHERRP